MKKTLLSLLFVAGCFTANAQSVIFEDGFETYPDFSIEFGDWINLDLDGLNPYIGGVDQGSAWLNAGVPQAFIIFNPEEANVSDDHDPDEIVTFAPNTGAKYAASWAGSPAGGVAGNNDWLVSPAVTLGAAGNELTFFIKSLSEDYGLEQYRTYVYLGSGTPTQESDFVEIGPGVQDAPFDFWLDDVYDLNAYAGQTIRVAVRNVGSDHYMLQVDDFSITTTDAMSVNDVLSSKFSVYPNPATNFLNISTGDNLQVNAVKITDINGRVVLNNNFSSTDSAQINIADLATGMYVVSITSNEGVATKKFMKK